MMRKALTKSFGIGKGIALEVSHMMGDEPGHLQLCVISMGSRQMFRMSPEQARNLNYFLASIAWEQTTKQPKQPTTKQPTTDKGTQ